MDNSSITNKAINRVITDYWNQYKSNYWQVFVAFSLPAIGNILVFFVPPLVLSKIVDIFVIKNKVSFDFVWEYIILFGVLWMLGEIFWRIGFHFLIKLETRGINNLAKSAFHLLEYRDYDFYTNNFTGSLTKKALAFSRSFETFTDTLIFNIFGNIFPIIFASVILWKYSPLIPLILLSCLTFVILIAIPIIRKRSKLVAMRHDASSKLVGRLSDSITNIFAVKSFSKEQEEYEIYGHHVDDFTEKFERAANFHNLNFSTIVSPLYVATNVIGLIAAIFFGQKLALPTGAIIVVFSYYSQITRIFWEINRTYTNIESSMSEAAEFTQMFIEPPTITDVLDAPSLKTTKADINFENVKFNYEKNESYFLDDFNLYIKEGQRVGLVGPSGGGKTTITKLLLRFADLQSGSISIARQDISKVTQKSLREALSYVPQEPLLFHRSIFENIAYSKLNATEEEVVNAAKVARAHEFITKLPDGYKTLVGERGVKLSGGQRQRVAIARALLKDSPLLILDEATSALDSRI